MKEFSFKIDAKELIGLRKNHVNARNSSGFVDCMNNVITSNGLLAYEEVTELFADDRLFDVLPAVEWPFPQMHLRKDISLLCYKTKIYTLDTTVSPWSYTKVFDFGTQSSWDEENTWQIVDFYNMVILTNGLTMLWYDPVNLIWENLTGSSTLPLMGTMVNYRGQLIGANFPDGWYGVEGNGIAWGRIGYLNMVPEKGNTSGFAPLPLHGDILRIEVLDKFIIVYGADKIIAMFPGETGFGYRKIANYGLMTRDSVFANDDSDSHVFLDTSGWVRKIDAKLNIERLGYREFFEPMVGSFPIVLHNTNEDWYYISDGTTNFVLSPEGLTKSYQSMTSGEFIQGGFIANVVRNSSPDLEYSFTTDIFDLGYRAQKTIQEVDVGSDQASECYVSIDYRFSKQDSFRATREVLCNNEGVAHLPCAGIEFRFNIRFPSYVDVNLDYISIKYKSTDRRFTRGPSHATSDTSRSS